MRRTGVLIIVMCLAISSFGLGCSSPTARKFYYPHSEMATAGLSSDEHHHRVMQMADLDRRALTEDLDLLFLTDRPTRLTRWQSR